MSLFQAVDLIVVGIANLINLVLTLIFLNRVFGHPAWEHRLGYGSVVMAIPLAVCAGLNLAGSRGWAFWALPLVMVAYLACEYVLDYALRLAFRRTAWMGPYLLLYYLALFAMIGYTFIAGRTYGFITLVTYFINLAATLYSYRRVGHGQKTLTGV